MTADRAVDATPDAATDDSLLLVAVCGGYRCQALRALQDDRSPGAPDSCSLISAAVRRTRRSVMLSTSCLGPCDRGAVVAVGRATLVDSTACWFRPPVYWGSSEAHQHAAALAQWIEKSAAGLEARSAHRSDDR